MNIKSTLLAGAMLLSVQAISCSAPKPATTKQEKPQEQEIANASPSLLKRSGFALLGLGSALVTVGCAIRLIANSKAYGPGLEDMCRQQFKDKYTPGKLHEERTRGILLVILPRALGTYVLAKFTLDCFKKAFSRQPKKGASKPDLDGPQERSTAGLSNPPDTSLPVQ